MYEENQNPFKRVGFHQETEPAQKKTLRPMAAPILTPGQRYGGSTLSSASSQHMDPEKPAIPPLLKKSPALGDTSAFSRLGERPAAPGSSASPAMGGSLWRAPSFADDQHAYTSSFTPPAFPANEPEDDGDFYLPPMDMPVEAPAFPSNQMDDDDADQYLPPMDAPVPEEAPAAAAGVRPMRGFGMPVFFGDVSAEEDDAAIQPEPASQTANPEEIDERPRRRSRRDRHAAETEEPEVSEPLYSAAPHAQHSQPRQPEDAWQDDPLYAHPAPYLEYHNFDPDSVPGSVPQHSGFTLENDEDDPFGLNAFQMGAAYATGQTELPPDDFHFLPAQDQGFAPGSTPAGAAYSQPAEDSYSPLPFTQTDFSMDAFLNQEFSTQPFTAADDPMDFTAPMDPLPGQYGDFPPPPENYPPQEPQAQEELYHQYAQMGQQVAASMDSAASQPRPVPVYTPKKEPKPKKPAKLPQQNSPAEGAEKPRFKITKELLGTIGIIFVALVFLFLVIAAGRAIKSFTDNQTDMQRHQQEYWDSHGYSPQDAAIRVNLPPPGETIPPTATPTPLPTATPTAMPSDEQNAVGAAPNADAPTTAPARSRLLRYPDNPLTDILPTMEPINKEYPDVKGQLVIPGILDEVVVQSSSGSYLSRNYRGTASPGGSVYMAEGVSLKQPPENMLLRASDSTEGKGFHVLWQYQSGGAAFCKDHAFATLTTLYEEESYVLFAVVPADTNRSSSGYFSFADKLRFSTDADMLAFVEDARSRSLYYFPVDVLPTDRLLTLATVSSSSDGQCMVLLFRMLRDGESIP